MEPKHESDRSSDEKGTVTHLDGQQEGYVNPLVADLPPDPDAHLSPEERAEIVRFLWPPQRCYQADIFPGP